MAGAGGSSAVGPGFEHSTLRAPPLTGWSPRVAGGFLGTVGAGPRVASRQHPGVEPELSAESPAPAPGDEREAAAEQPWSSQQAPASRQAAPQPGPRFPVCLPPESVVTANQL